MNLRCCRGSSFSHGDNVGWRGRRRVDPISARRPAASPATTPSSLVTDEGGSKCAVGSNRQLVSLLLLLVCIEPCRYDGVCVLSGHVLGSQEECIEVLQSRVGHYG